MTRQAPKKTRKPAIGGGRLPGVLDGTETTSQALARLIANSSSAAHTVRQFARTSDNLDVLDLVTELRRAGDEAVAGNLDRFERALASQALTLDVLFHDLMQRAGRQDDPRHLEVLMRLALKAQSQARATIGTLATVKYPMPYIRQANIAHGHQQVNNAPVRAGKRKSAPSKLLEVCDERLEPGAAAAAGRVDPTLEAVGASHGPAH